MEVRRYLEVEAREYMPGVLLVRSSVLRMALPVLRCASLRLNREVLLRSILIGGNMRSSSSPVKG
jgi:hypothetical protein